MPYDIDFGMPPAGYSLGAARGGETATIQFMEFTSTQDGQHFIQRLDGFPSEVLQKLAPQRVFRHSEVDTLLAIVRGDPTATVYVNEVEQVIGIRPSRAIVKGELVLKSDIIDVGRLELKPEISCDVGVVFLFSIGWRKGLFYDFGPIGGPAPRPRDYDLGVLLGRAYCHVLFQERFSISDDEWSRLLASQWFLFAGLGLANLDSLLSNVRAGWDFPAFIDDRVGDGGREGPERRPRLAGRRGSGRPEVARPGGQASARNYETRPRMGELGPVSLGVLAADDCAKEQPAGRSAKNLYAGASVVDSYVTLMIVSLGALVAP